MQQVDQYLREQVERWRAIKAASEAQHGPLLDRLRKSRVPLGGSSTGFMTRFRGQNDH
jgi:hypothetical protein